MHITTMKNTGTRPPMFPKERWGYSKGEVEAYIAKLRTVNEQLAGVNNQLFLLWIQEFEKEKPLSAWTAEGDSPGDAATRRTLIHLLEQSAQYARPAPAAREDWQAKTKWE